MTLAEAANCSIAQLKLMHKAANKLNARRLFESMQVVYCASAAAFVDSKPMEKAQKELRRIFES